MFSNWNYTIWDSYHSSNDVTLFTWDCIALFKQIPDESIQLIVTSPPYNIGKEYEKRTKLSRYIDFQREVIQEAFRVLKPNGSICWQIGNYVDKGEIVPLDIILYPIFSELWMKMRNRIVWHFWHWLHASKRFSWRYETIMWFTKSDNYYFDLDPIRIPQKYPNKKHFKWLKKGQLSCNPLWKNPSDVWEIPNVKNNHVEKTEHPCQFPVELIERLVLSLTHEGDTILDPFAWVGTTNVAAFLHNRKSIWADIEKKYIQIARGRILSLSNGILKTRQMNTPLFIPKQQSSQLSIITELNENLLRVA